MPSTKKAREATDKASISFNWSDEEVELLLEVVLHFKSDKAGQGLDWESIKTNYLDIRDIFIDRYPKTLTDESYPHHDAAKHFTKERIISKVKALRNKFKIALDSGRRSGGGKVVAHFYNLCTDIWGGCPAAESITGGIDSSASTESSELSSNTGFAADVSESCSDENQETSLALERDPAVIPKRSFLEHLKDARHCKLVKNVSYEKQMMQMTKEDMALKKQMMSEIREMNINFAAQMNVLTNSLVNVSNTLTTALNQPQQFYQQQPTAQHMPNTMGNSFLEQLGFDRQGGISQSSNQSSSRKRKLQEKEYSSDDGETYSFYKL